MPGFFGGNPDALLDVLTGFIETPVSIDPAINNRAFG
ncbi:MAG: barstar family protein [Clostridia bacterium]|nr:barstar family protein [Clostridia bacterium]